MKLTVTIPTEAQDVRPDQTVVHESQPFVVDELAHLSGDLVRLALRPPREGGRRRIVELDASAAVRVVPTLDQADELSAVIADALGAEWTVTWVVGDDDFRDVITEELGVTWNAATGRLEHDPDEQTSALLSEVHDLRHHSALLNDVAWRMAAALGDVLPGDAEHVGNVRDLLERLIARASHWQDDHDAELQERPNADDERATRALRPPQQLDADPDGAGTSAAIVGDDDKCGATGLNYRDCDGDHVHIRAKGDVLDGPLVDGDVTPPERLDLEPAADA